MHLSCQQVEKMKVFNVASRFQYSGLVSFADVVSAADLKAERHVVDLKAAEFSVE